MPTTMESTPAPSLYSELMLGAMDCRWRMIRVGEVSFATFMASSAEMLIALMKVAFEKVVGLHLVSIAPYFKIQFHNCIAIGAIANTKPSSVIIATDTTNITAITTNVKSVIIVATTVHIGHTGFAALAVTAADIAASYSIHYTAPTDLDMHYSIDPGSFRTGPSGAWRLLREVCLI